MIFETGYPEKIINTEMSKVKFNVDENKRSNNRQKKWIPFLVTFHPKLQGPPNHY